MADNIDVKLANAVARLKTTEAAGVHTLNVALPAGGSPVTGPLTNAELRATSVPVSGPIAHDSPIGGFPMRIAGRAVTAAYASVATGDTADLISTVQGVQVMRPFQIPELEWSFACAAGGIVNNTAVAMAAAAGAGLRRYITSIQLKNVNAVATEVAILDGVTIIWRGHVSASMVTTNGLIFADPLKTSANAALNIQCLTTGAQLYASAQGFTAP